MGGLKDHTFKTYIVGNREHFLYGETGLGVPPLTQIDLPFTVSLLRLLYLDLTPVYDLSDEFRRARRKLMETREARYAEEMREHVEAICDHHLYFEITRMDWRERFELAAERHYKDLPGDLLTDLLRERDITWIPSQIQTMQEQALALIEGVMDIEGEKVPFRKRLADFYTRNSGSDIFAFSPRPISYELIDRQGFAEVLHPRTVYDLIDFYFRECVKRELRARVCKTANAGFSSQDVPQRSIATRHWTPTGAPARNGARSASGRRNGATTKSFWHTAASTSGASPGSARGVSARAGSMLGARRRGR